jgi:hypothetical protein
MFFIRYLLKTSLTKGYFLTFKTVEMEKNNSTLLADTFAAIGIIAAFYSFLALVAFII